MLARSRRQEQVRSIGFGPNRIGIDHYKSNRNRRSYHDVKMTLPLK